MPDIYSLFSKALADHSKSTALKPLGWLVGLTLTALITSSWSNVTWLPKFLAALTAFEIVLYLVAYGYFAVKNPDSLRSEHFSIQKLAIENRLVGDDQIGMIEMADAGEQQLQPALPEPSNETEAHD